MIIVDKSAEATLALGAEKELAYLKQFGGPLLPLQRARREYYQFKKQLPSVHIENLERYLLIAPSLVPGNPALHHFRIRHPDLRPSNIIVSRSPDSSLHVVSLINWQHTSILPLFLLAGIPEQLQNFHDLVSRSMTRPLPPENLDDLDEIQQSEEMELHRLRLVHYHYVKSTEKYNQVHWMALADLIGMFRRRIFHHASDRWEGETLELKVALIDATQNWEEVTGGCAPCPVVFDPDDVHETRELDKELREMDECLEVCQAVIGHGTDGWVPVEYYEEAMAHSKKLKEDGLAAAESEADRAEIEAHWPFDDIDEEEYM